MRRLVLALVGSLLVPYVPAQRPWPSEATILASFPAETPMAHDPTVAPPSGTERWIEAARQDLAKRLGIAPVAVALIEYRDVIWPDGALGCPRPGLAHVQVRVDGYVIRLRAGERVYQYHGGGGRGPFLCERPSELPAAGAR